jgi:hypothetical protein
MQNDDWMELFRVIPEDQHNTLVLTTFSGVDLSIETLLRADSCFLVFRGRVCGQTDDGRVFFLPYRQIDFLQLNRTVKEEEVKVLLDGLPAGRAHAAVSLDFESASAGGSGTMNRPGSVPGSLHDGLPASPASPTAPAAIAGRGAIPAATRGSSPGPTLPGRQSVVPAEAATAGGRPANVPAAALAPTANGVTAPAPPRNSILERLRAQRNAILPPRPPAR